MRKKKTIMEVYIICRIYITLSSISGFSSQQNSFSQWTKDVEYNFFRGIYLPRFFIYFIFLTHDDSFPISERYLFNWSMNVFFYRERYLFFLIQYVYLFFDFSIYWRILNNNISPSKQYAKTENSICGCPIVLINSKMICIFKFMRRNKWYFQEPWVS